MNKRFNGQGDLKGKLKLILIKYFHTKILNGGEVIKNNGFL